MTFREITDHASQSAIGWAVAALLGGVFWLIRRVFTNHKQIEMMQAAQAGRDEERVRERAESQADISEIKADIKNLLQR